LSIYTDTNPYAVGVRIVNGEARNVRVPDVNSRVDNGDFEAIGITARR
jgi:hypothetical protein